MEAAFPPGTLPVSSIVETRESASQPRHPPSHRLLHHALATVAAGLRCDRPAGGSSGYNPVVIVGPAGAGKSRLVSEWFVKHNDAPLRGEPRAGASLWDGRSLARDLTAALSQNTIDRLHDRFVSSRLIVIDAIEQITAWDAQRTLAHLFDAATAAGTVFLATMRIHPIACTSVEPSLASRLAGGLVVSMPPGTTRCDVEGGPPGERRGPSLRRVIGAVARRHGLTADDLIGPARCRQVSLARGMAMYLARRLTPRSLQAIGAAFGGRDHTTVLHGIRVTERRRSGDPGIAAEIDELIGALMRPS